MKTKKKNQIIGPIETMDEMEDLQRTKERKHKTKVVKRIK